MFDKISENKQKVDFLLSVNKAIKNLVVHSTTDTCECYIDSSFRVFNIDITTFSWSTKEDLNNIAFCVNKAIHTMLEEIQKKSQEVIQNNKSEMTIN